MTNTAHSKATHVLLASLLLGGPLFTGCRSSADHDHEDDHAHGHIVYHHRPADFKIAVLRLDEIHQTLMGSEPLPAAKQFEDGNHHHEDTHGEAPLNSTDDAQHQATENSAEEHHDSPKLVEVGIFQELFDIVRWLPTIAADSDLPKTEWDQINEHCRTLAALVQNLERDYAAPGTGDLVNIDANRNDANRNDANRNDANRNDANRNDANRNDANRNDANRNDANRNDANRNDANRNDANRNDTSRNETARASYRARGNEFAKALDGLRAKLSVYDTWHKQVIK